MSDEIEIKDVEIKEEEVLREIQVTEFDEETKRKVDELFVKRKELEKQISAISEEISTLMDASTKTKTKRELVKFAYYRCSNCGRKGKVSFSKINVYKVRCVCGKILKILIQNSQA